MRNGLALKDALPIAEGRVDAALDFISGASLLVKRAVLERIGLFSEEYFLYYEDVDFCLRAKKAGFSLAWAKASVLVHKEGGTTGAGRETRPPWADYLGIRNRIFFTGKHYPRLLPVVIAGLAGVCLRRILRRQPERLKIVFAALLDGLWARMGRSERLKALFPAAGGKG
jgi:GT2 family glycosyltransferase